MSKDSEREEYFRRLRGVGEGAGQYWRHSSYGRGEVPGVHPAMLTRGRKRRRENRRTALNALAFLAVVLGIPAVVIAIVSARPSAQVLVLALSNVAGVVIVVASLLAVRAVRRQRSALHGRARRRR